MLLRLAHIADAIVQNYTDYYHAYLKYLQDTMTGSDTAMIESIANKCPAIDGAVVFSARALYQRITMKSVSYFDDSCEYNGGQYRRAPNNGLMDGLNQYGLYPNPNNGEFAISQSIVEDKVVSIRIYNALGLQIGQQMAEFKNGIANFKLQNVSAGLYLICITDEQNKTTCLKFNIL